MFCCQPQTLYLTLINASPYQLYSQQPLKTLQQKLCQSQTQTLMPKPYQLQFYPQFQQSIFQQQFHIQIPEYELTFQEETRQLQIRELVKDKTQKVWNVLRKDQKQDLVEGDCFSFDSYDFQIYKINNSKNKYIQLSRQQHQTDDKCRICFSSVSSQDNPLLNFCLCTGSIKYIHLQCNRQWIKSGVSLKVDQKFICYTFIKSTCELCQSKWLKRVKYLKNFYYLFNFNLNQFQQEIRAFDFRLDQSSQQSYNVVLALDNVVVSIEDDREKQCVVIIKLKIQQSTQQKQTTFTIGKQQYCDLSISDFVSSPVQCQIQLNQGKITIKDCNSVNGTQVDVKCLKNLTFNTKSGLLLKYDSKTILIKGKNSLFKCFEKQIIYKVIYKAFNQK